nr:cellulosomal serpin precursor [Piromyces sp. E2]
MKNLSLYLLGLVFIYIPACLSQKNIRFDPNNGKINPWNKIKKTTTTTTTTQTSSPTCFSQKLKPSYPCCKGNKVIYTDKDGYWGIENGKWCGIDPSLNSCFSVALGYPCCKSCKVYVTDKYGDWGVENNKWCGIKKSCPTSNNNGGQGDIIEEPAQNNTDVSTTEFEFSFLKMENKKKNMLYSPLSIEYALNMLQEGANKNTYTEINKVIGNAELPKYASIEKVLSLANGLFVRDTYYENVRTEYIKTLKEKYDAEIIKDEFKDANNANQWIEDKTLGIIKNMLEDDLVQNPNLVMLIINALAIDMEWATQFSTEKTYGETFYKDDGENMTATMMFKKEEYSDDIAYYMDDDVTVLSMNLEKYSGTQFEFLAIMPKENLSGYVENVTKEQINELDTKLKLSSNEPDGVNIKIPKFKFSYDLELKKDLINLGIKDAFDEKAADFTKMAYRNELYVSEALHKADIEFTEKGVKAAAVTVFGMMTKSAMPIQRKPVNVVINKPFMFVIRDKSTKGIWFTGTVYEPNSWEKDKDSYIPTSRF